MVRSLPPRVVALWTRFTTWTLTLDLDSPPSRYGFALITTLGAILVTLLLAPLLANNLLLFCYAAVVFNAWLAGLGPGLLSAALSIFAIEYFLVPPLYAIDMGLPGLLRLAVLGALVLIVSSVASARRRAREELAAQRELLSVTLTSIGDAVIATDSVGRVTFLNTVAQTLTGWAAGQAAGQEIQTIFDIVNEQTRQPVENPVVRVLREGTVVGLANHTVLRARDGREIPIDDSGAPIRDRNGDVVGVVLVFRDVSAARASEGRLARQAALLDLSGDAIIARRLDGTIISWNAGAERLYGWKAEQVLGQTTHQVIKTQFPEPFDAIVARLEKEGHWEGDLVQFRRDGSPLTAASRWEYRQGVDGEPPLLLESNTDITARKQAEEEREALLLREQAARQEAERNAGRVARLQAVTAALSEAVTVQEIANVFIEQGRAALSAQTGVLALLDEAGTTIRLVSWDNYPTDFITRNSEFPLTADIPFAQAIRSGTAIWVESEAELYERFPAFARTRPSELCSFAVIPLASHGRTIGAFGVSLSEYRQFDAETRTFMLSLGRLCAQALDRARLYSEAQAAISLRDKFFTVASHELKTPLTSLMGYAELFARRTRQYMNWDERDRHAVQVILEQTERLNRMISALLDASRIDTGKLTLDCEPMDLCALVRRVVEEIQPGVRHHQVELLGADEPLVMDGDALRLEQVLQNLVQNAVKYSPRGGRVTIEVERNDDHAQVCVKDEGIGIPAEALPRLFSRFYRAPNAEGSHISGLGIGLYVVREIVELHGGHVEVESSEGKGSTFRVWLPLRH